MSMVGSQKPPRRSLLYAAAWTIPVISLATASPASAASAGSNGSVRVEIDYNGPQFDGSLEAWSVQARLVNNSDPQAAITGPLTLRLTYPPADPTAAGQTANNFSGGWTGGTASANGDGTWSKTFANSSGIDANGNLSFGALINYPNGNIIFEIYDSQGALLGTGVIPVTPATPGT